MDEGAVFVWVVVGVASAVLILSVIAPHLHRIRVLSDLKRRQALEDE